MKLKTFVINMRKDTERLDFMSAQLKSLDIPFSIQEGIDGGEYDFKKLYEPELAKKLNGAELTKTEKGCALSHRLCIENFIKSENEYCLIMEDDLELPKNFKTIIEQEIKNREKNKTNWDYLSFNYPPVGWKGIRLWLYLTFKMFRESKSLKLYIKIPLFIIKFTLIFISAIFESSREILYKKIYRRGKVARFYRPLYLAGCYMITREGGKKLLSVNEKLVYTADRLPNIARIKKGLKFYAFVPLLTYQRQDKFKSNNTPDNKYILFK